MTAWTFSNVQIAKTVEFLLHTYEKFSISFTTLASLSLPPSRNLNTFLSVVTNLLKLEKLDQ